VLHALGRGLRARSFPRAENLRTAALLLGAPAAVLCTPYGTAVLGYYGRVLGGGDFARYVVEWQHTQLGPLTAGFFVLAGIVAFYAGRQPRRLTRFEQLSLALLAAMALDARRNVVWFALAALVSLPKLLAEDAPAQPRPRDGRVYAVIASVALTAAAAVILAGPVPRGPVKVGAAVAALTARDPALQVFPEEPVGDWLLWNYPQLAGRVAWDVRDELLRGDEIARIAWARNGLDNGVAAGYRLFVVDRVRGAAVRRRLLGRKQGRVVAHDGTLEAILLPHA
jgi:hypothetical protein